jgi:hypothetical protein
VNIKATKKPNQMDLAKQSVNVCLLTIHAPEPVALMNVFPIFTSICLCPSKADIA